MNHGGENLVVVESLNDRDEWVEGVLGIIDGHGEHKVDDFLQKKNELID
jgi:hypothetical protein